MKDLIKLDSWEKYIDEKVELEYFYGISSIWSTIHNFEGIVEDMIKEVVAESAALDKAVAEKKNYW